MNLQKIFDKSVTHMLTQGHQSSDGTNSRYRSDKGSCAIGCFIPDMEYQIEFDEGNGDGAVRVLLAESEQFRAALESGGIDTSNCKTVNLLEDLQCVHDNATNERFIVDVKNGAYRIAKQFGLTYNSQRTQ